LIQFKQQSPTLNFEDEFRSTQDKTFEDEAQSALFKDPILTAQ